MSLADTNFPSEKNFEVENFQLLTIFSENFLSVEIFLEWKWALITLLDVQVIEPIYTAYNGFYYIVESEILKNTQ